MILVTVNDKEYWEDIHGNKWTAEQDALSAIKKPMKTTERENETYH